MKVIADVKCYHCGHVSGELIGVRGQPLKDWLFEPAKGAARPAGPRLRCLRCNGPVYLEDVRPFIADEPTRSVRKRLAGMSSAA